MGNQKSSAKSKIALKIIGIISAWVTVPIIGLALLFVTLSSSTPYAQTEGEVAPNNTLALSSILGIILISILILFTTKVRHKPYFFHLRIGLFIGLGVYFALLTFGLVMSISPSSIHGTAECTTLRSHIRNNGSAIVPISTDLGNGTGFAVNDNSTILTAFHVIDGANSITANYSSGEVGMTVLEVAPQYDLALLKIDKPTPSHFNLNEQYIEGDDVFSYGYPSNTLAAGPPSLSAGIVSRIIDLASLRMTNQDAAQGLEIIQTDAAINPGNSGGPLVSKCGVIGIVSFISDTNELHQYTGSVSEQNIGFAISSKTAKQAFPTYLSGPHAN